MGNKDYIICYEK